MSASWTIKILAIGCLHVLLSGGLINFNKFMVDDARFPHPMTLTAIHMLMSYVLCLILYMLVPSLFPAVETARGHKRELYKWLIPIGVCFAVMLYGSNAAYLYCSVAFLQFMKEANSVLVFLFSCALGLQVANRQKFACIVWIITGSSLCVAGEINFALTGFLLQASSQVAECLRCVLAEKVLQGSMKLDPLSYTMFMAPICLAVLLVGNTFSFNQSVITDFKVWWPYILPNACLAFALNVTIATVIKEINAVGFIIMGIVKDIALVIVSSILFQDPIRFMQWISFFAVVSGVSFWSLMKIDPDHQLVLAFERLLRLPPRSPRKEDEATALLGERKV